MKLFLRSRVVAIALLLTALYFAVTSWVSMAVLMVPLTGAALGGGLLVTVIYAPLFWQSTRRISSRVGLLALGMGLLWTSVNGRAILGAYYRAIGESEKLLNNQLVGFFVFMGLVGAILHVVAPGYPAEGFREKLGGRYRWLVLGSVIGGGVIAYALTFAGVKF